MKSKIEVILTHIYRYYLNDYQIVYSFISNA